MNARGNPESLVRSHPGNTNAAKSGVYSSRLRVSRAEEIARRFAKQTVLEVAERAVMDEVAALRELEAALLGAIERFGVSTRAGAGRGHLDQLSRVSRQLERLAGETWLQEFDDPTLTRKTDPAATTVELPDGAGSVGDDQGRLVSIRVRLFSLLALRDALDEDLRRNGAVSRRGGERRQVGQRLRVSRDLVRMIAEVRRVVAASSASDANPTSTWELARELAFRPDTPTAPRLRALAFLLDTPGPPPELSEYEREIQTWSPEQVEAELARLTTADDDGRLGAEAPVGPAGPEHVTSEKDPRERTEESRRLCLEMLQLITRGADPHASPGHRLQAAALYDRCMPGSAMSPWEEELRGMSAEEIDRELAEMLDWGSDE